MFTKDKVIYIIIESRLSVCYSPLKRSDVQRRNFACGRVPCVCNIWAGSYVDRGHRWEESENFTNLRLHFCCGGSKPAAILLLYIDLDVGRVAGLQTARRPNGHVTAGWMGTVGGPGPTAGPAAAAWSLGNGAVTAAVAQQTDSDHSVLTSTCIFTHTNQAVTAC